MAGRASNSADDTLLILGEVRGQLREIIHAMNNQAQKNDAVADKLAKLEGVPAQLKNIDTRLTALETDRHRRDGASGLLVMILRSPALGWLVGAGTTVWAFLTGRLHL